ncbi:hypothetical protein ACG04Q_04175 [Roseateles sp. DXS20W]|uniref:Type III secretion protein n=1 Tax=Pelomonas lactea TaxID=3299030 RepID=A0ABW7GFN6_9BURK
MSPLLPDADARQWLRLRQLRVQRARQALARALDAEREARAAVDARELRIAQGRARLDALAQHWGRAGSADMPRWNAQLQAHRDLLAEQLERDEYALLDDQEALQQAQTGVARCRGELARAQARESAVDATVSEQRRQRLQTREQAAELEAEEVFRTLH